MKKEGLLSLKEGLVNAIEASFKEITLSSNNIVTTLRFDPEIIITNTDDKMISRIFRAQHMMTMSVDRVGSSLGQRVRAIDLDVETLVEVLNRLSGTEQLIKNDEAQVQG
jgi:hypothetical protein